MAKRIAVGSDHGGFALKKNVIEELRKKRYNVYDAGTHSPEPCDYPDVGFECAARVSRGKEKRAILICRTGIGMAIIANKLPGVRAGVCDRPLEAVSAREHNDINVLVLAADRISVRDAVRIVNVWLSTRARRGRHARRVDRIKEYEQKVFKKNI